MRSVVITPVKFSCPSRSIGCAYSPTTFIASDAVRIAAANRSHPLSSEMKHLTICLAKCRLGIVNIMEIAGTAILFVITAVAEIIGCYLPYLWLRQGKPAWLLIPAALSLALFAYLLTLHPTAAGRVYAAYGGVYISVALAWLWLVDGVKPARVDLIGVALAIAGMAVIMFGPRD